jgi:hypothetical protein
VTREKWAKITPEQQRIKIAELFGWKFHAGTSSYPPVWTDPNGHQKDVAFWDFLDKNGDDIVPDYLNDLDAMHDVERHLLKTEGLRIAFASVLSYVCGVWDPSGELRTREDQFKVLHATAAQRCEALALTLEPE